MSLFGPRFHSNGYEPNYSGLFRLIDDFDKYSSQGEDGSKRPGRQTLSFITPKFDVYEDDSGYHLNGELPGVPKENVHLEFVDDQTISVRGKVERSYQSDAPPAVEGSQSKVAIAAPEGQENKQQQVAKSGESTKSPAAAASAPKPKYWVSERSVGEFNRTFNFPSRIDVSSVKAGLENGILNVTVPKARKAESKRITIS